MSILLRSLTEKLTRKQLELHTTEESLEKVRKEVTDKEEEISKLEVEGVKQTGIRKELRQRITTLVAPLLVLLFCFYFAQCITGVETTAKFATAVMVMLVAFCVYMHYYT